MLLRRQKTWKKKIPELAFPSTIAEYSLCFPRYLTTIAKVDNLPLLCFPSTYPFCYSIFDAINVDGLPRMLRYFVECLTFHFSTFTLPPTWWWWWNWKRLHGNIVIGKLNESEPEKLIQKSKAKLSSKMCFFISLLCGSFLPALSSAANRVYPTSGNKYNVELENLFNHYKSTGQVN